MALQTKTITANGSKGYHKFTLNVTEENTSIANNNSPMSFSFVLSPIQTGWDFYWGSGIAYTITINGESYSGNITAYDGSSTITIRTGTLTVPHNDDGSKTINISFTVTDTTGQNYTPGNASASEKMILTKIPRASSISVSNYDLGQNPNIVIGKKVNSFTSTLSYRIGRRTGTLVEKTNASSYVWEMTEELINQIKTDNPNNKSVSATVYCVTYDGNTQIGSQTSTTFTLTITDKPVIIDVVRAELNANISALTDKVLRSISQNQFTINATAPTGTTIASYKVANGTQNNGNVTSNIVNLNDIQTFYDSDGILKTKFIITCIDARGNVSEEYPFEFDFVDYVNVSINKTDVKITRTTNTSDDALLHLIGNFYNGLIGETQNELTIQYKYREQGTTEYSELKTVSAIYENNTFKIDNLEIEKGINYQENYEFVFLVTDLVNNSDDMTYIFTSSIPFELHHKNGAYFKELDTDLLKIDGMLVSKTSCAKMITNFGARSYTSVSAVEGWDKVFEFGDYKVEENQIVIKNTTLLQLSGTISGSGGVILFYNIIDEKDNEVIDEPIRKMLYQFNGNGYFMAPLSNMIFELDPSKTYRVGLSVGNYYSDEFSLNNGFGKNGTQLQAKKIL